MRRLARASLGLDLRLEVLSSSPFSFNSFLICGHQPLPKPTCTLCTTTTSNLRSMPCRPSCSGELLNRIITHSSVPNLIRYTSSHIRLFVSDPVTSHGFKVDGVHGSHDPHWLAIRQDWSRRDEDFTAKETLATLRSLSQTCKSLRVFALPLLWTICQVKTVEELGRLRETLRASPAIASHVRHFSFSWNMGGDYYKCDEYEAKEGTLLDLAFRNRCELWNSLRAEAEGRMLNEFKRTHDRNFFQSKVAGMKPGWAPPRSADAVLLHHSAEHEDDDSFDYYSDDGEEDYYWSVKGSGAGGDGPDGRGEDRLVKSVSDFNSCLVEIVAQLGSLTTFGWAAEAAAMPMGVLESLEKLTTLSHLHLSLSGARGTVHACE